MKHSAMTFRMLNCRSNINKVVSSDHQSPGVAWLHAFTMGEIGFHSPPKYPYTLRYKLYYSVIDAHIWLYTEVNGNSFKLQESSCSFANIWVFGNYIPRVQICWEDPIEGIYLYQSASIDSCRPCPGVGNARASKTKRKISLMNWQPRLYGEMQLLMQLGWNYARHVNSITWLIILNFGSFGLRVSVLRDAGNRPFLYLQILLFMMKSRALPRLIRYEIIWVE